MGGNIPGRCWRDHGGGWLGLSAAPHVSRSEHIGTLLSHQNVKKIDIHILRKPNIYLIISNISQGIKVPYVIFKKMSNRTQFYRIFIIREFVSDKKEIVWNTNSGKPFF